MNEAPDDEREPARYIRLPWPVVGAGLFVLLVGLLGFGLFANRNLRSQNQALPVTSAPVPIGPATPTAVILLAPTSPPVPTSTAVTREVLAGTVSPKSDATLVPPTPPAQPTLDATLVTEVTEAFDQYWQVRSEALLDLDKAHLAETMGGDHLDMMSKRIDELRAENRAIRTDVDHQVHVLVVNVSTAQVLDDYISNTIYVDPASKEPLSQPASDELRVVYRLQRSEGKWKVVDSVIAD